MKTVIGFLEKAFDFGDPETRKKITEDEIAKSGPLNWFLFELFQHLHGLRTIQNYCRATLNNRVNNICQYVVALSESLQTALGVFSKEGKP